MSVCGEAAGDPQTAALLVGLGVRELSMSPLRAARVLSAIRRLALTETESLASHALACRTTREVADRISAFEREVLGR